MGILIMASAGNENLEKLLNVDDEEGQFVPGADGDDVNVEFPEPIAIAVDDARFESPAAAAPAAIIPAAVAQGTHDAVIPINPFVSMEGAPSSPNPPVHIVHAVEGRAASICR